MADFNGIVEFHDGLSVHDYVNIIPLGKTCVDRIGDTIACSKLDSNGFSVRGVFVDSLYNVYIAYGDGVFRYSYDQLSNKISGDAEQMMMYVDGELVPFRMMTSSGEVSFCESSLKPSEVFLCDGQMIYAWATYDGLGRPQYKKFRVNVICPPTIARQVENNNGATLLWSSDTVQPDFNSLIFGEKRHTDEGIALYNNLKSIKTDKVEWFDNRLVTIQLDKNTVWISRTDPMYYWRDVNAEIDYIEPNDDNGGYELWCNWYSSSANSDRLLSICSYKGQLYFFNNHTIEIWSRTGNEDAPIQSATQQVLHFGGTLPTIVEGILFFLGIDSMNENFIGSFSPQFARASNKEIENRLGKVVGLHKLSQYNETHLFVKQEDGDGFVLTEGRWWRWVTPVNAKYKFYSSIMRDYAVADDSSVIQFDKERRISGGERIPRYIREGFKQLENRKIIRRIELVADTGRTDIDSMIESVNDDRGLYCAISTNRGLSFSQPRYRTLGKTGHNNKVIEWRNLGSGNSILVEIGTSSLHKLQIYDMVVDIA